MQEYLRTLGDVATAAAGVITVLSLIALLVKGATYLGSLPRRLRTYFFYKPRYILIPTPEELAKYCEKAHDPYKPNNYEIIEDLLGEFVRRERIFTDTSKYRITIMYYSAAAIFSAFSARLLYFGMLDGSADDQTGFKAILALLFLGLHMSFFEYFNLMRKHGSHFPLRSLKSFIRDFLN